VTSAAGGVGVLVRLHPLNTEPERVEILALCSRVAVHARRMVELFVVATVFGLKADVEAHLRHPSLAVRALHTETHGRASKLGTWEMLAGCTEPCCPMMRPQ
jgi:hypothetical protein